MPKKIPNELVSNFIEARMLHEKRKLELEALAADLRKYADKGYEHPDLRFDDNLAWRPDWKKIAHELAEKYMLKGPRTIFFNRTLRKRFPPKPGLAKINIVSAKYEEFKEKLKAQKKKLGLLEED